jgi:hypothetical protein
MNYFLFIATVSLIFQLAIVALLIGGFWAKKKEKFRTHGFIMLTALALHLSIIFALMVPSFIYGLVPIIVSKPTSIIGILSPVHAATGTATAGLGTWVIVAWRLRKTTAYCAPKARIMLGTFIVWFTSLSLGILLYFVLNWKFLFG